ncbi:hypothetical protein VXP01_05840 [Acinetobacter pittii]
MNEILTNSFWDDTAKLINSSTKMEISWGQYVHQSITNPEAIELYIKSLANKRAVQISAPFAPYPGVVNPFTWVEEFSKPNTAEKNFFETRVTDYKSGDALAW